MNHRWGVVEPGNKLARRKWTFVVNLSPKEFPFNDKYLRHFGDNLTKWLLSFVMWTVHNMPTNVLLTFIFALKKISEFKQVAIAKLFKVINNYNIGRVSAGPVIYGFWANIRQL